jgi:hypothetical protein
LFFFLSFFFIFFFFFFNKVLFLFWVMVQRRRVNDNLPALGSRNLGPGSSWHLSLPIDNFLVPLPQMPNWGPLCHVNVDTSCLKRISPTGRILPTRGRYAQQLVPISRAGLYGIFFLVIFLKKFN